MAGMSVQLFRNISEVLTLEGAAAKGGRRIEERDLGIAKNQSILVRDGLIEWIGPSKKVPKGLPKKIKEHNLKGFTLLPGLVECHTHTVFAGSRAEEFEMRLRGASYQEIAAAGGGILSTMKKTRSATPAELLKLAQERADRFVEQGVTTLEIKSGYGLNLKDEMKCLEVARKIKGPRVISTFLGAHALPGEFSSYAEYLEFLTAKVLPQIAKKKLARRVDIFIEKGFFASADAEKYLAKAKALGFEILIHADQLSLSGGADLAVKMQALSGDHLLQIQDDQIAKLARSEVSCVLLPTSDLYMRCAFPPARKLIEAGARVVLATDFNPGSSPSQDLALTGLLARLEMKMTLPEVISAYTVGAAHALNLQKEVGSLSVGKSADFLCTDFSWQNLFYSAGQMRAQRVYRAGKALHHKI